MSFFEPINTLLVNQLRVVAGVLDIPKEVENKFLSIRIKEKLIDFYRKQTEKNFHDPSQIAKLWRDIASDLISKKKVKECNEKRKQLILHDLKSLTTFNQLNDPDAIEGIVRDILILFWEELNEKGKQKFRDAIRKDLEKYKLRFTDEELEKMARDLLLGTLGGVTSLVGIPIVSGIMLQQLTQGFMAWLLINVLGQKALQVAVLSSLAGPLGWGISASAIGIGTTVSVISYNNKRNKLCFFQAVMSIYAYRYQNRFNERREVSE